MFEEVLHWIGRRAVGYLPSQLFHLLEEDSCAQIATEIEREGNLTLSNKERVEVLRQIRKTYQKRPYPEATFEDWHDVTDETRGESDNLKLEQLLLNPKRKEHRSEKNIHFDAYVKKQVLLEFREKHPALTALESNGANRNTPISITTRTNTSSSITSESESSSDSSSDDSSSDSEDSETKPRTMPESRTVRKQTKVVNDLDDLNEENERDGELNPDAMRARRLLKLWAKGSDTQWSLLRDHFTVHKAGLEVSGDLEEFPHQSIQRQHVITLTTLLHVHILRQDWPTAYKVFAVLSKLSRVDFRSIWPLGSEILRQLEGEAVDSAHRKRLKTRQFDDWLILSIPLYAAPVVSLAPNHGPVFRTGSKTWSPKYTVEAFWKRLREKQYTLLRDSLEGVLLTPPYEQDGVFHYMMLLCCLSENADLLPIFERFESFERLDDMMGNMGDIGDLADDLSLLASKENMKARVSANNTRISKLIDECKSRDFEFSQEMVQQQVEDARARLDEQPLVCKESSSASTTPNKKVAGYRFEKGEVFATHLATAALPRHHFEKLVIEDSKEVSSHWSFPFYDRSIRKKAFCLVCGESLQKRARQRHHLQDHGITEENWRAKLAEVDEVVMAKMVETQHDEIPDNRRHKRGKYKARKRPREALGSATLLPGRGNNSDKNTLSTAGKKLNAGDRAPRKRACVMLAALVRPLDDESSESLSDKSQGNESPGDSDSDDVTSVGASGSFANN